MNNKKELIKDLNSEIKKLNESFNKIIKMINVICKIPDNDCNDMPVPDTCIYCKHNVIWKNVSLDGNNTIRRPFNDNGTLHRCIEYINAKQSKNRDNK